MNRTAPVLSPHSADASSGASRRGGRSAAVRPLTTLWEAVGRAGRGIHWYVTSLMGDNAYRVYLDHHALHGHSEPALTERQFWRERMDEQDRNPGARCC